MTGNAHKQAKQRRDWLAASKHVLRGVERDDGPEGPGEYLECSCGWVSPEQPCWHDDVVLSDLAKWGHAPALLVYPGPDDSADMSLGGVVRVAENGSGRRISTRELKWLVDQPSTHDLLREVAVVAIREHARATVSVEESEEDLTVTINGIVVDGWLDGSTCDVCDGPIVFDERNDAEFCPHCNRWTSEECNDRACDYCPHRPQPPLNRKGS